MLSIRLTDREAGLFSLHNQTAHDQTHPCASMTWHGRVLSQSPSCRKRKLMLLSVPQHTHSLSQYSPSVTMPTINLQIYHTCTFETWFSLYFMRHFKKLKWFLIQVKLFIIEEVYLSQKLMLFLMFWNKCGQKMNITSMIHSSNE